MKNQFGCLATFLYYELARLHYRWYGLPHLLTMLGLQISDYGDKQKSAPLIITRVTRIVSHPPICARMAHYHIHLLMLSYQHTYADEREHVMFSSHYHKHLRRKAKNHHYSSIVCEDTVIIYSPA